MSKRGADKYLTDQNWDQEEDDDEEAIGVFKQADEEVLKKRVFRKAKRRVVDGQSSTGSAFAGFTGLAAPATNKPLFQGFNLPGNNASSTATGISKGFSGFPTVGSSAPTQFKLQSSSTTDKVMPISSIVPKENTALQKVTEKPPEVKSSDEDENSQNIKEYNRHLSALNRNVSDWIKNHVEKNPLCDLTPVFRDYKKHLAEIEEKFGHSDQESSHNSFAVSDSQETVSPKSSQDSSRASTLSDKSRFTLSGFGATKSEEKKESEDTASTQVTSTASSTTTFTGFQTSQNTSSSPFKGFNIPNKPAPMGGFHFSTTMTSSKPAEPEASDGNAGTEEEYVPPKPPSSTYVEEDAFYSIRCKLYYQKGETFTDRGVGQLYLKPSGDKTQLLIRADTAISQVLLNILLQSSMPIARQGKNNILISCVPNPPIDEKEKDKIYSMLIRVKTGDDADKLHQIMEEKKKDSPAKGDADR